MRVAAALETPVWRVGLAADADVRIVTPELAERGSAARIELPNGGAVRLALQVPGLHNLRNATAALAAALELGVDLERCVTALERFSGVARRFERVGEARGVMIVDDYAHHPTEVLATLAAARQTFPRRRVVAVFQPHLFSRTALHGEALGRALASADVVVVAPIYGAREQPLPGVTADLVAQGAARAGAATVAVRDRAALVDSVAERLRPGDVVFTLGAGDVTRVGPELLRQLGGAGRRGRAGGAGAGGVRQLPAALRIELREVEPAALAPNGRRLAVVDAQGRALPCDPARTGLDLPVAAAPDRGVVGVLALVQAVDPALFLTITSARGLARGDVLLELGSRHVLLRRDAGPEVIRAVVLVAQDLAAKGRAYAELDARFARQVIVRRRASGGSRGAGGA